MNRSGRILLVRQSQQVRLGCLAKEFRSGSFAGQPLVWRVKRTVCVLAVYLPAQHSLASIDRITYFVIVERCAL